LEEVFQVVKQPVQRSATVIIALAMAESEHYFWPENLPYNAIQDTVQKRGRPLFIPE